MAVPRSRLASLRTAHCRAVELDLRLRGLALGERQLRADAALQLRAAALAPVPVGEGDLAALVEVLVIHGELAQLRLDRVGRGGGEVGPQTRLADAVGGAGELGPAPGKLAAQGIPGQEPGQERGRINVHREGDPRCSARCPERAARAASAARPAAARTSLSRRATPGEVLAPRLGAGGLLQAGMERLHGRARGQAREIRGEAAGQPRHDRPIGLHVAPDAVDPAQVAVVLAQDRRHGAPGFEGALRLVGLGAGREADGPDRLGPGRAPGGLPVRRLRELRLDPGDLLGGGAGAGLRLAGRLPGRGEGRDPVLHPREDQPDIEPGEVGQAGPAAEIRQGRAAGLDPGHEVIMLGPARLQGFVTRPPGSRPR